MTWHSQRARSGKAPSIRVRFSVALAIQASIDGSVGVQVERAISWPMDDPDPADVAAHDPLCWPHQRHVAFSATSQVFLSSCVAHCWREIRGSSAQVGLDQRPGHGRGTRRTCPKCQVNGICHERGPWHLSRRRTTVARVALTLRRRHNPGKTRGPGCSSCHSAQPARPRRDLIRRTR